MTLHELAEVTRLLAKSGATIIQLNTLRKHIELLKGGGLAKAAFPAKVDVIVFVLQPSELRHYWLGDRKAIQPEETSVLLQNSLQCQLM